MTANFTIYVSKLEYLNPEESMCDLNLVVNFSELYILTTEDSPLGEGQNLTFESECLLFFYMFENLRQSPGNNMVRKF